MPRYPSNTTNYLGGYTNTSSDNIHRGYGYQYDKLNRLTDAYFGTNHQINNHFNEHLSYDKNGNINNRFLSHLIIVDAFFLSSEGLFDNNLNKKCREEPTLLPVLYELAHILHVYLLGVAQGVPGRVVGGLADGAGSGRLAGCPQQQQGERKE